MTFVWFISRRMDSLPTNSSLRPRLWNDRFGDDDPRDLLSHLGIRKKYQSEVSRGKELKLFIFNLTSYSCRSTRELFSLVLCLLFGWVPHETKLKLKVQKQTAQIKWKLFSSQDFISLFKKGQKPPSIHLQIFICVANKPDNRQIAGEQLPPTEADEQLVLRWRPQGYSILGRCQEKIRL